jgi:hypothetical protein
MYVYTENNSINFTDRTGNYCVTKDGMNAHPGKCTNPQTSVWVPDKKGQIIVKDGYLVGWYRVGNQHIYEGKRIPVKAIVPKSQTNSNDILPESDVINQIFTIFKGGERSILRDGVLKNSVKINQSFDVSLKAKYSKDMNVSMKGGNTIEVLDKGGRKVEIMISNGRIKAKKNLQVVYSHEIGEAIKLANLTVKNEYSPNIGLRSDGYINVFDVKSTVSVPLDKILGNVLSKKVMMEARLKLTAKVGVSKKDTGAIIALSAGSALVAIGLEGLFTAVYRTATTW